MLITGNVISFTASTKVQKQGGGTYDAWELVYRDSENAVKSVVKPATGLRFKPALKQGLLSLNVGDPFTMVMEKENDYWTPQTVSVGIQETQDVAAQGVAVTKNGDGNRAPAREGRVTGSNYETPEERAKKQVVIVRQGVLNAAIAYCNVAGHIGTGEEVIAIAREFEKYVYKDLSKFAKKYLEVTLKEEAPQE